MIFKIIILNGRIAQSKYVEIFGYQPFKALVINK